MTPRFRLPLPAHPLFCRIWGWNWAGVARAHKLDAHTPPNELYELKGVLCDKSPATHVDADEHAVDFLVPDGTPVLAAADGKVVCIQEIGTRWASPGRDPTAAEHLNYITIRHMDGVMSQYCHIAKGSASTAGIRVGSTVRRGTCIGRVGKNGYTTGDHLHFMVYVFEPFGGHRSIPVPWE